MPVTSPDNIWTPDSGDDYALTVDLARTADDVQEALNRRPAPGSTNSGIPYRMAAGSFTVPASGVSTVTFPAGRFTVAPRVSVTVVGAPTNVSVPHVGARTATGFEVRVFTLGAAQASAMVEWIAVQMTPTSGAG